MVARYQIAIVAAASFAAAASACATGGALPPNIGESGSAIGVAQQAIAEAVVAGADTSASDVMQIARQHLATAQNEQDAKKLELAAVHAREAAADANYARAAALRVKADQARASEAAQLQALPSPGSN